MIQHESVFVEPICNYGILKKVKLLGGGGYKKPIYKEEFTKKEGLDRWTVCRFNRRLCRKEMVVFLVGVDTTLHTMKRIYRI